MKAREKYILIPYLFRQYISDRQRDMFPEKAIIMM